jgi:cysteine synthase A
MSNASAYVSFHHLWHLVGNTPMIQIRYRYKGKDANVFAKCEHYNLTGSIKDRMALYILQQAYTQHLIHPGDVIIEATSGNTGIAFAAIGRALGHPVIIIMPDWLSRERMDIIRSLGATIQLVSKEEGGFIGSIRIAEEMTASGQNTFLPRQFENIYNVEAHSKTTASEIWHQLLTVNLSPSAIVAGVGTGGTIMGMNHFFKERGLDVFIHPIEPAESPTLSTGYKTGSHRIQGISDEFIPSIVQLDQLDPVIPVNDGDAILIAQLLGKQLGLGVGISSGANIAGAIRLKQELPDDAVVVTFFADSNKKYLSTDLLKEEPSRPGFIANDVTFLDYLPIPRSFEKV